MTRTPTPHALRVSETIHATPERLYRAWTEPEELARWWCLGGPGWSFAGASVDLRVGGGYRLSMTNPAGKTHVAVGVYREIEPPTRLAFTWDWENPAERVGDTLVTVEFRAVGDGTTEVVLTHERFATAAQVAGHASAWAELLRLLEHRIQPRIQERPA